MVKPASQPGGDPAASPFHPFRRAVLRGLGVVMPPLLTVLLFVWVGRTILTNVLEPLEALACDLVVWSIRDVYDGVPPDVAQGEIRRDEQGQAVAFQRGGLVYVRLDQGRWIPQGVYSEVQRSPGEIVVSNATATQIYEQYVHNRYLRRSVVLPFFACLFVILLYLLGKFFAAGIGRILWNFFESLIQRLPVIRNVYSAVKQVTDFVFSEQELEFNRVVAVEYPRKGIWSIGFVTGESMADIRSAANEPVLAVLMPTSPMPATGFTITVRKSETIDLDLTIDQAIQFVVSCGVVVPRHQMTTVASLGQKMSAAIAQRERTKRILDASADEGWDDRSSAARNGAPRSGRADFDDPRLRSDDAPAAEPPISDDDASAGHS